MKNILLRSALFCLCLALSALPAPGADKLPEPAEVPDNIPEPARTQLRQQQQAVKKELGEFLSVAKPFNAKPASERTQAERDALLGRRARYIVSAKAFNQAVADASVVEPMLFTEAAAELVEMFNRVSASMPTPDGDRRLEKGANPMDLKSLNCSYYFRGIGRELRAKGLPASELEWTGNLSANQIADRIVSSGSKQWRQISEAEVQESANRGIVVVGVTKGQPNGHVAVAFPIPQEIKGSDGTGPFVRDGNETLGKNSETGKEQIYARDWGAARASKAWNYKSGPKPMWYVWLPSKR